jgi:hypothetical protein
MTPMSAETDTARARCLRASAHHDLSSWSGRSVCYLMEPGRRFVTSACQAYGDRRWQLAQSTVDAWSACRRR